MSDDDIVEMSIAELTAAFAEALKTVRRKGPEFEAGDRVKLAGVVTGVSKDYINLIVESSGRSLAFPISELQHDTGN